MKPIRLLAAVIILAALGGAIWWTNKHPAADATKKDALSQKLVPITGADDIVASPSRNRRRARRRRRASGKWVVTKPMPMAADQDAANMMIGSVQTLTWDRMVDEHPASLASYGLDNPPLEVDVTLKNGKTTKVLWGSDTPAGNNSIREDRRRPESLHHPDLHQNRLRKNPQRSARQATPDLQPG